MSTFAQMMIQSIFITNRCYYIKGGVNENKNCQQSRISVRFVVPDESADFTYEIDDCDSLAHERRIVWRGPPVCVSIAVQEEGQYSDKDRAMDLTVDDEVFA
jgi:hypothetical protein